MIGCRCCLFSVLCIHLHSAVYWKHEGRNYWLRGMQWSHYKGTSFSFLVSQKALLLPSSFSVSLWVLLNHDSWSRSKSCNWSAWGTPCSPVWVNNMCPGALSRNNLQPKELFAHHHFFWHFIFNECLQTLYIFGASRWIFIRLLR